MRLMLIAGFLALAACGRLEEVGRAPDFTPTATGDEYHAMVTQPLPVSLETRSPQDEASLWSRDRGSLLGDRRAMGQGDILTVVIEIDDRAEISNSTARGKYRTIQFASRGSEAVSKNPNKSVVDSRIRRASGARRPASV